MNINSFYLSRIKGNKIYDSDMKVLGVLKDIGIVNQFKNPKVVIAKIKTNEGIKVIDFTKITVSKQNGQYALICSKLVEASTDNTMFLVKHVLDKQIIDVNGRKVVRVNDIRLATTHAGIFVVAVDIGTDGLLRRIGIAKTVKMLGIKVPSKLMLWNEIEAIRGSNENIQMSKTYNKLSILHPSDLADIIEDFDTKTGVEIFSTLDNARAADVLEEMEEDAQLSLLNRLPKDKAADVLEEMPADEVADILDGLREDEAEEYLKNMEKEASDEVRELLKYEEDEIGSLMSTEIFFFKNDYTVDETVKDLRKLKPEEDQMYNLYVVDNSNKLIGTLSLRDVIISEPDKKLEEIMHKDFKYMYDKDNITDLIRKVSKYNLVAVPVVDENMDLLGNVIINDIIYELLKSKRKIG